MRPRDAFAIPYLRARRVAHGMTRRQLAELSRVSERSIEAYEYELRVPRQRVADALARALHCRAQDLRRKPTIV